MTFEIKDYFETPVILEPRVELYTVYDFMGKELPGLAIVLDMPIQGADEKEQFAILTKSFEEFIGLKNSASWCSGIRTSLRPRRHKMRV